MVEEVGSVVAAAHGSPETPMMIAQPCSIDGIFWLLNRPPFQPEPELTVMLEQQRVAQTLHKMLLPPLNLDDLVEADSLEAQRQAKVLVLESLDRRYPHDFSVRLCIRV